MDMDSYSAFPVIAPEHGPIMTGLSKREYFAAAALQGILASMPIDAIRTYDGVARNAVSYADALLQKLNETQNL